MNTADLSATELLTAFATGTASPVEATRDALDRVGSLDRLVNAFCLVDADRALAAARQSERRWRRGEPRGALDGVPTSVKDVFLTAGWPTLRGSWTISADQEWTVDAPPVARLREHGAVLLGKTTTPELGWKGVTDSPRTGSTGNPWDPSRTAGGSSGGSAAALALGMGALSVGTDGGGSVRIPAGFCGTVALKPTFGRVPHWPASPFGTLAHAGPMTRTVPDAALLLDVLAGPDSRDAAALPPPSGSFREALEDGVEGLRVAFSPSLGYVDVDPEVAAAVRAGAEVFARLGARVEQVDPGFADPVEAFCVLWFAGAAKVVEHVDATGRARMDPALVQVCEQGARYSALDYLAAAATRTALGQLMGGFHERHDLLLTPTLPIPAFEVGREVPSGWPAPRWTSWTPFTYPFNMTQQPAVTVPCGLTGEGLPVGLQLVGARYADALVLRAARAYERARPASPAPAPLRAQSPP